MRNYWISTIAVVLACAPQSRCAASDVEFGICLESFCSADTQKTVERISIELIDRVWAIPGVEGVEGNIAVEWRRDRPPNYVEIPGIWHVPKWLDEIAWPRTRAIFRGEDDLHMPTSFIIAFLR